jgi:broad specificity phosphatase PhoE
MRLILIRHGQTPSNVLGLLDTEPPGPGLTELGTTQASAVPATLAGEAIDAVYASTAVRAQLTAAPLAAARRLEVVIRPGVREIAAGDWEMLGDDKSVRGYLELVGAWLAGDLQRRSPGGRGESGVEVMQRFDAVIDEIAASGVDAAAVVAHGAVNRTWASLRADNLDDGFGASHPLRNTGIVILDGDPLGGWNALSWTGVRFAGGVPVADDEAEAQVGTPDEDPFDEQIPVSDQP